MLLPRKQGEKQDKRKTDENSTRRNDAKKKESELQKKEREQRKKKKSLFSFFQNASTDLHASDTEFSPPRLENTTPGTSVTTLPPPLPPSLSSGSTSDASAVTEDLFPFRRLSAGGVSPATARIQPGCLFLLLPPPLGLDASEAPQPLAAEGKEEEEEEEDGAEGEAALLGLGTLWLAFVGVDFSTRALAQAEAVTLPSSPSAAAAIAPSVAAAAAAELLFLPFTLPR